MKLNRNPLMLSLMKLIELSPQLRPKSRKNLPSKTLLLPKRKHSKLNNNSLMLNKNCNPLRSFKKLRKPKRLLLLKNARKKLTR